MQFLVKVGSSKLIFEKVVPIFWKFIYLVAKFWNLRSYILSSWEPWSSFPRYCLFECVWILLEKCIVLFITRITDYFEYSDLDVSQPSLIFVLVNKPNNQTAICNVSSWMTPNTTKIYLHRGEGVRGWRGFFTKFWRG